MTKFFKLNPLLIRGILLWNKLLSKKPTQKDELISRLIRPSVPKPPTGLHRIKWLGPGFLWMVSAVGSGAVLFTPRIGSRYGYTFFWLMLLICFFMWVMIRESGRYTVITGETLLEGFHKLPGPKNWAIWIIFLPQCIAAISGVASLSALVGSAFMVAFSGSELFYTTSTILITCFLVITGGYKRVEQIRQILAFILMAIALLAAIKVFPAPAQLIKGLLIHLPKDIDLYFLLPWVGTILAGSMGIIWYSYWTAARGYGGYIASLEEVQEPPLQKLP